MEKQFEELSYNDAPSVATVTLPTYRSIRKSRRKSRFSSARRGYFFIKRSFDIVSSLLVILVASLFLLIILGINTIATKGHPIYADQRIGKDGKIIHVYKFRSMFFDANDHPERYLSAEQMKQFEIERKVDSDPRITKFGRIIRKLSLDELPQLFNILNGTMSVIGPRPISTKEYEENYTPSERQTLCSVRPGLVGNWAVNGRSDVTFESGERQRLELDYVHNCSLKKDLAIVFLAIPAVFKKKGAK